MRKKVIARSSLFTLGVIFLIILAWGKAGAMQLSASDSLEIMNQGISLYVGNLTDAQKSEFIASLNGSYGLIVTPEELGNKSLSSDKKDKIWEEIKKRAKAGAEEKKRIEARTEEDFMNSFTYKKSLFLSNLTFYLASLDSGRRERMAEDINIEYSLNISALDLYDETLNSEIRAKIVSYLRAKILALEEINTSLEQVIPAKEFISENGNELNISGQSVSLELSNANGLDSVEVGSNGVRARAELNLNVDRSYIAEGDVLRASLSNRRNPAIKIMPDKALDTALAESGLKCSGCQIELKEYNADGKTRVVYQINAKKQTALLFVLSKEMNLGVLVDAENGDMVKINKPWWAFLAIENSASYVIFSSEFSNRAIWAINQIAHREA